MKQILIALLIVVTVVTLIVITFTISQANNEQDRLQNDLIYRSTLLANSLKETVEPNFINKSDNSLELVVKRFTDKERFAGLGIYDNKGNTIAASTTIPDATSSATQIVADAMDADKANGDFTNFGDKKVYALAVPLHNDKSVVGALLVVQNAGYIDDRVNEIWRNNLIRLVLQASLISLAVLLLIRWLIYQPIKNLVETLKLARTGNTEAGTKTLGDSFFFRPLQKEISNIQQSLSAARLAASEEARLRVEKSESPWTAQRLQEFTKEILKGRSLLVASYSEPYTHIKKDRKIEYFSPAGGVVTALDPIMQSCGGTWIAWGNGNADREVVDSQSHIKVPPNEPKYTLRRLWLTQKEADGFYTGFCKEGLWPLCHVAHIRPTFRSEDWEQYGRVNAKYAQAVLSEIKNIKNPLIFIQDFHLALVPRLVKKARPDATIGIFWHSPWPNPELFSICPWKKEILDGILGADLIGFQTQLNCNNFIETVGRELESKIDFEQFSATRHGHTSYVKSFPISIAFSGTAPEEPPLNPEEKSELLSGLGIKTQYLALGVERFDYTKGIIEKFKAIEIFLTQHPEYIGNFSLLQIVSPTSSKAKKYQEFAGDVRHEAERINSSFKAKNWKPIVLVEKYHNREQLSRLYQLANICMVTSLHDGMNLVAKEFVASRTDEKGMLILSQFTGAARELKEALIINPYDGKQTAQTILQALEMSPIEQTKRMRKLRKIVMDSNVFRWSSDILEALVDLSA